MARKTEFRSQEPGARRQEKGELRRGDAVTRRRGEKNPNATEWGSGRTTRRRGDAGMRGGEFNSEGRRPGTRL